MHRRFLGLIVVSAVVAAFALPGVARGDAVTDWNTNANSAIFATTPTAHAAALSTAMVQAAVYDAVNAIAGGYQPYLSTTAPADPSYSQDAAAVTAAFGVAKALVSPAQVLILQTKYDESLAAIDDGPAKSGGIEVGEAAAAALLAARANDGRNPSSAFPFVFGTTPGVWRKSPPLFGVDPTPWVGNVTPFLVPNTEMLRTDGPNALTSDAYAKDFDEVKSLGSLNSTTRTDDQTMAAIFWQSQPGGLYGGVMKQLSTRFGLSTAENARLYAMTSLAAADGAIGCWNDKYYWNFWRPIDAIREAASDGNRNTEADPGWLPLYDPSLTTLPTLSTPSFPDHPSGHTCVSSATLNAMQDFFGTDKIAFDITSTRFPTTPRHYDRFSDALKEVIDARVWGGIHFRTADEQGAVLGKKVARWEEKHYFQPTAAPGKPGAGTCSGGQIISGTYSGFTVTGNCTIADGAVVQINGNLTVTDGAILNDHAASTGTVHVTGNVKVGKGAVLGLGYNAAEGTLGPNTVGGSIVANQPLTIYLGNVTVHGNLISIGGGDPERNFPIKDNTIHGNVFLFGWKGLWMGLIRNTVGGSVWVMGNRAADTSTLPGSDSTEIQTNDISGNLICLGNSPAAQVNA
ncbi:MAG: vanadium-dependent haloperoxidase, partial [Mycobacterium sp.]